MTLLRDIIYMYRLHDRSTRRSFQSGIVIDRIERARHNTSGKRSVAVAACGQRASRSQAGFCVLASQLKPTRSKVPPHGYSCRCRRHVQVICSQDQVISMASLVKGSDVPKNVDCLLAFQHSNRLPDCPRQDMQTG